MNEMLDRLEAATDASAASSPTPPTSCGARSTRLRTQLEVALAQPGEADWPELAAGLLSDSTEMERLVRDLLFLAPEDEGSAPGSLGELVDLDDIVLEEAARATSRDDQADRHLGGVGGSGQGNREQLRRLLRNLLDNAVRYAATCVQVSLVSGPAASP